MQVADTLDFLLGRWTLERVISDHRAGARSEFRGAAELTAPPGHPGVSATRARYREHGRFRSPAYEATAHRTLHYLRDGGGVVINFADGHRFIELDLRGGAAEAQHACGDDDYRLGFWVPAPDVVEERWWVQGPAKDYEARTVWRRIDGIDAARTSVVISADGAR